MSDEETVDTTDTLEEVPASAVTPDEDEKEMPPEGMEPIDADTEETE